MKNHQLYVAAKAQGGELHIDVTHKFTGELFARVAAASKQQLEQAIKAGKAAETSMRKLPVYERQRVLEHCASAFEARFDELTKVLMLEGGKPKAAAEAEVKRLISTFKLARDAVTTLSLGDTLPLDVTEAAASYRGMTMRVPVGLCAFISPFNFPLNLTAHKIAPAIAAGCPFILKPASATPLSALIMGEVLSQAGLPEGAFSILPMSSKVADQLVTDERIKLLSFTGSDVIGWDMKARAGKKKVVLELGGNAAVMVEPGTNLEQAVPRIITGAYSQAGQVCISVQRVLIHDSMYEETKLKLVEAAKAVNAGDPEDANNLIGPMISESELKRAVDWIESAASAGGSVLVGGKAVGQVLPAHVLEHVPESEPLYKDEAFCPVMILESYSDFEAGLAKVNSARFGLQVGVFTPRIDHAMQAWDQLEAGGVIINDVPTFRVDNMPYGGVKDSGFGREGIRYAIEDMSEERLLVIKSW